MSEQNQQPKQERRTVGKLRQINTKNGPMFKIFMDNLNPVNPNGTPNEYYKGTLLWIDSITGKQYQVKQLGLWIPQEGLSQKNVEQGYSHLITLNLDNEYEVTVVG